MDINFEKLARFEERLQDEESRELFRLRSEYAISRDGNRFLEELIKRNYNWRIMREDDFSVFYKGQPIVIFGAGTEGALTKQILEKNGYNVYAFADNNPKKWGGINRRYRNYVA